MAKVETPRLFPIMGERTGDPKTYIPWALIAPHEAQALANHTQTLHRLWERGGLDPTEAVAVLEDRDYRTMAYRDAHLRLGEIVAARTVVMEPDTAYMPVPRCASCAHWTRGEIPVIRKPSHGGTCTNPELRAFDGGQAVETAEDFGCVQWEARASTRCTYQSDPSDPQTRCILQVHEGAGHSCPDWPGRKDGVR